MEPMLETMHKNCLSSQSCKFVQNYFSKIIFLHAHVQCVCIVMAKYQMAGFIQARPSKIQGLFKDFSRTNLTIFKDLGWML